MGASGRADEVESSEALLATEVVVLALERALAASSIGGGGTESMRSWDLAKMDSKKAESCSSS